MKRRYRYDPDLKEVVEITAQPTTEWVNTGIRYGRETLDKMKREGLVPPEDFKETWAKAEAERKRLRGELPPSPEMREERRRSVAEAFAKYEAGYRPPKRDNSWLKD